MPVASSFFGASLIVGVVFLGLEFLFDFLDIKYHLGIIMSNIAIQLEKCTIFFKFTHSQSV